MQTLFALFSSFGPFATLSVDGAAASVYYVASASATPRTVTQTPPHMFTRKDYLNGTCTFRQYYAQYVSASTRRWVLGVIGEDALLNSTDPHLNDIPLRKWDRYTISPLTRDAMRGRGDFPTDAGAVCIAKECARQLIEFANSK